MLATYEQTEDFLLVRDLHVSFRDGKQETEVIRGIDLELARGEAVGLVGESGSGKSVTGRALMGILDPSRARVSAAHMSLGGVDLGVNSRSARKSDRRAPIAMIFQNPFTSLNPVCTIGDFLREVIRRNLGLRGKDARRKAIELLDAVRIPNASARLRSFPHELSGGQQQRVVIAIALALEPELLIADEPTTALDVTVQAEIVGLLSDLQRERQMSVLFISHDLSLISDIASRVYVMYAGKIVEDGPREVMTGGARMPYTRGLTAASPSVHQRLPMLITIPGSPPMGGHFPSGCAFRTRCPLATEICAVEVPPLFHVGEDHKAACLHLDHSEEAFSS